MADANIQILHKQWQSAVKAHASMISSGRMRGLSGRELDEFGQAYALRIDLAFMRLKQAEEEPQPLPSPLFN